MNTLRIILLRTAAVALLALSGFSISRGIEDLQWTGLAVREAGPSYYGANHVADQIAAISDRKNTSGQIQLGLGVIGIAIALALEGIVACIPRPRAQPTAAETISAPARA